MSAFWAKQPNGKYCRFSTVIDCITDYDCTKKDMLKIIIQKTKEKFERDFEQGCYSYPFDNVIERFMTCNMPIDKMDKICRQIEASEYDICEMVKRVKQIEKEIAEEDEAEYNKNNKEC